MELAHLIAFNLTLLAAILSPGPAMLYFIRTTLASGRMAGLYTVWGLGVMAATWTALAFLGLDAIFAVFPWAFIALKTIGALYLIWIAYQTWTHARAPMGDAPTPPMRAFWGGMLVNMSNPKSVLFAGAVIMVIFPQGMAFADKSIVVLNHLVIELIVGSALVLAFSTKHVSAGYLRAKPILDRIAASVLGFLGLKLLLSR
ncbi:threonine/homoserine/homoserine lactone efflux protein [Planktotalea frisia]|jgi:threonine/homoserine/homoserine lactone efflux protein|uniref:Threonine efflux protein n=1 Tax=Planktotalea frisia TaxID=696762 RepID=A0A1L9NXZ8_9RHOB|nr:LysE family transporter [Planktotalea frisia]OJI94165.1 threonine efflux protein [Planktotalea frisia]PZX29640.1 threonine/homoserine/homoserine lactone efflux protein [Planktotalea frisia]